MKRVHKDDTKLLYANPKSREVLKQRVRQVFNLFDTDGSGEIDAKEFHDLIYSMGKIMTDEEVAKYLAVLDRDGNGSISFDEFFDWWCTRDNTHSSDHSADKLKEVKAKLQSRSLMRSISYLINKAKNDLEAEKAKIQHNTNDGNAIAAKSANGRDPNTLVVDSKITIGNLATEDIKAAIKLSYTSMSTSAKFYRLEFQLTDGATDQDAEKIKQFFVAINATMAGMLFQDISVTVTPHGNVRHATLEMSIVNSAPAEAALRNAHLKKLQFSAESSQRFEELNLKTIQLNLGMHMEASKLILGLLPPAHAIGPFYHGFLTMTQRIAFELNFASLHEAVANAFRYEGISSNRTNTSMRDMARQFRSHFAMFGITPNLPIAELKQIMVQIEHDAFVLDVTGVDISFLFKDEAAVETKAPEIPTPQPVPVDVPLTVPQTPEVVPKEPEVPPQVIVADPQYDALKTWLSQFSDTQDETKNLDNVDEGVRQYVQAMYEEYQMFSAKRTDPSSGKVIPVILDKTIPKTDSYLHEASVYQKLKGLPYVSEYMDWCESGRYVYVAAIDYTKLGYVPLSSFVVQQSQVWPDKERVLKDIVRQVLSAAMMFSKDYVTHCLDMFVIHPETFDLRLTTINFFREHPVTATPENLPVYNLPPELFTLEGAQNYGVEVDVWGYGILCYAFFTGIFPYNIELGEEEIMNSIVAGDWKKTAPEFTALPEKTRNFISRLLTVDKNARPTFREICDDEFFRL